MSTFLELLLAEEGALAVEEAAFWEPMSLAWRSMLWLLLLLCLLGPCPFVLLLLSISLLFVLRLLLLVLILVP